MAGSNSGRQGNFGSQGSSSSNTSSNEKIVYTLITFFLQLILIIAFCIVCLIALIITIVGVRSNWKPWWFLAGGTVLTLLAGVFGFIQKYIVVLKTMVEMGKAIALDLVDFQFEPATAFQPFLDYIPSALILMLPASIGAGAILGGIVMWLVVNRPEFLNLRVKPPKKAIISFPKKMPRITEIEDGTVMGINESGEPVVLKDFELNMHAFIVGATGVGKTNTILVILESAIRRGKPVIVVDGKGDPGLINDIQALSDMHGRTFQAFSYKGTTHYNPLKHGEPTELKDKLVSIQDWGSEPFFRLAAERYLQLVFKVMKKSNIPVDMIQVKRMMILKNLQKAVNELALDREEAFEIREYLRNLTPGHQSAIEGLADRLGLITESDVGPLFTDHEDSIDLYEAVLKKKVVVMSLSGLSHSAFTPAIGAMIVEDLKTVAAAIGSRGRDDYIYVVMDEFNLFAGEQVVNLINKSRSVGFCCLIATQELADLEAGGGTELVAQVVGNTNVKIVHRQDVPSSAEYMSEIVGTEEKLKEMVQAQASLLGKRATGSGNFQSMEEQVIHPNVFKNLGQGQAVIIKKVPSVTVDTTKIRPAPIKSS